MMVSVEPPLDNCPWFDHLNRRESEKITFDSFKDDALLEDQGLVFELKFSKHRSTRPGLPPSLVTRFIYDPYGVGFSLITRQSVVSTALLLVDVRRYCRGCNLWTQT